MMMVRSSRSEVFYKKSALKEFTGKHLCQSLFFNKVATSLKKRLWYRCFHVNFKKYLRTTNFIENLWWLLLHGGCKKSKLNKGNTSSLLRWVQSKCHLNSTTFGKVNFRKINLPYHIVTRNVSTMLKKFNLLW